MVKPETRQVHYASAALTENTRASYPINYIDNARLPCVGPHPRNVVLLCCDAFGVLPPVSRLTLEQAMYHFISGYTSKVRARAAYCATGPKTQMATAPAQPLACRCSSLTPSPSRPAPLHPRDPARAGGGHRDGRHRARGHVQRLLRRRLPHVAPHEVRRHARRAHGQARHQGVAGQHRLDGRRVRGLKLGCRGLKLACMHPEIEHVACWALCFGRWLPAWLTAALAPVFTARPQQLRRGAPHEPAPHARHHRRDPQRRAVAHRDGDAAHLWPAGARAPASSGTLLPRLPSRGNHD